MIGLLLQILMLPFTIVWALTGFFFTLLGKLITMILGLSIMIVGLILAFTVIGFFVGIPLLLLGFAFVMRSLF